MFHSLKLFFTISFFFTMVIKQSRELRGESAFRDQSAPSMSKGGAGVNSDQVTSDLKRCLLFF